MEQISRLEILRFIAGLLIIAAPKKVHDVERVIQIWPTYLARIRETNATRVRLIEISG